MRDEQMISVAYISVTGACGWAHIREQPPHFGVDAHSERPVLVERRADGEWEEIA